jgi:hypothetical protein
VSIRVRSTQMLRLHGVSKLRVVADGIRVQHVILAERRRSPSFRRVVIADWVIAYGCFVESRHD